MKIRDPDLSNDPLQKEHVEVGLPQLESGTFQGEKHPFLFLFCWIAGFCMLTVLVFLFSKFIQSNGTDSFSTLIRIFANPEFWKALIIGFLAQVIDGALGMAYGISATSFLKI